MIIFHTSPAQHYEKRRWDKFSELADRLNNGKQIVFTGTEAERDYVESIICRMKDRQNVMNFCGEIDLMDFAKYIRDAELVVTVNTLAMHLAIHFKVPTVAIIGGTPASVVVPPYLKNFRYVEDPGLKYYDPETGEYPIRKNEITVDQVMEKVNDLCA